MIKLKKFLSVIFSVMIISQQAAIAEDNVNEEMQLMEDNAYGLLMCLGLMDEGEMISDIETVSRSTLARKIYYLSANTNGSYTPVFEDVTEETENAEYISALAQMGIISIDDKYYPEDNATYEQAVKMIVGILGYNRITNNIKWPEGYMSIAASIGLTDDINAKVGDVLTERMLISLIYNSLDCEIMIPDLEGNYNYNTNQTILTENFKVYKKRGIVNANERTYLSINGNPGQDMVVIGDEFYTDLTDNLSSLLGYDVYVYYRDNGNDEYEAIYAYKSGRNNVTNIRAKYIEKDEITDFSKIVYLDGDRIRTVKLSESMDVIYNGKAFTSFSLETITPDTGNLELIDNNGDSIVDVIMVWEFDTYVYDSNDKTNEIIIDKYGKYFDYSELETIDIYSMYGEKVDFNSLAQWNVMSVYESMDGEYAKIVIYDDPVIGTIESMYTDDGESYIVVDDEHYAISKSYQDAVESNKTNAVEIRLNQEGIYYLDADERVAAAVTEPDYSFRYAYLVNAVCDEEEQCMFVKLLYDETKGVSNVRTENKFKIDGKRYDYLTAYKILCNGEENPKQQLVKFMLNGDGNVIYIDTAEDGIGETKKNLTCNAYMEDLYWSVRTGRLGKGETISFLLDLNNTTVFNVPQNDVYNYDRYSMTLPPMNNNQLLKISAYDSDTMGVAEVIVIYSDTEQQHTINIGNTGGCIISNIEQQLNSDDEPVYSIEGYKLFGGNVHYITNAVIDASDLQVGDFVDFNLDFNGEIEYIHKIFDAGGRHFDTAYKVYNEGSDGIGEYIANHGQYITGNVIAEKNGNYIKVPLTGTDLNTLDTSTLTFNNSQIYSLADAVIYICKKDDLIPIDISELESYKFDLNRDARCLFFVTYSQLRSIVIYVD